MSTNEALIVGAVVGFFLGSLAWLIVGTAIGILQHGIEEALREKLNLDKKETPENGSS